MALRSAHGGHIYNAALVIPNDRWSGNWRVRDSEVTQSDSGGCTLYLPIVQDNEWEFTAARDDVNFPEAIGLQAGTIVSILKFKLGSGARADVLTNTTVTDVAPVNDNKNDAVRVTVRGHGGFMTPNVAL